MNHFSAMLAQATMEIPLSDTMRTLMGLIGIMVLGITVLTFVLLCIKLFGRKPSISKEIEKLRREIYEVNGRTVKAVNKDIDAIEAQAKDIIEDIEEIKVDRERKWQQLTTEIHAMELRFATLTGRIEALLKKLEGK